MVDNGLSFLEKTMWWFWDVGLRAVEKSLSQKREGFRGWLNAVLRRNVPLRRGWVEDDKAKEWAKKWEERSRIHEEWFQKWAHRAPTVISFLALGRLFERLDRSKKIIKKPLDRKTVV